MAENDRNNSASPNDAVHNGTLETSPRRQPAEPGRYGRNAPAETEQPNPDRFNLDRGKYFESMTESPELFEKRYLTPYRTVPGYMRPTLGNPTPVALVGLLLPLTPLSCQLMGWRGAGGDGAATIGVYFFMGGLLMFYGSVIEIVLGNTFSTVVFATFGGFWFSFGATLVPQFSTYGFYAAPGEPAATGLTTTGFNVGIGFWFLFLALAMLVFFICSLRTNVVYAIIFFSLIIFFCLLTGSFFSVGSDPVGNAGIARRCLVGAGSAGFVASMAGWYLLGAILLADVDFPIQLPVGDLSHIVKGRTQITGQPLPYDKF